MPKKILLFAVILSFLLFLPGCFDIPTFLDDHDGFWTTDDGNLIIDCRSNMGKIKVGEEVFFLDLSFGHQGNKIYIENTIEGAEDNLSAYPNFLVFDVSYDNTQKTMTLLVTEDNVLGLLGQSFDLKLVSYEDAPQHSWDSNNLWLCSLHDEVFDFSAGVWEGNIQGTTSGNVMVFPNEDVFYFQLVYKVNNDPYYIGYYAKVIDSDCDVLTCQIFAANGDYVENIGETFTLTKVTE